MEERKNQGGQFFRTLYRTRFKVRKDDTPIINLSALFSIISLLTAPWLVVGGIIVALIMGYKFSIDRTGVGFESTFEEVVETGKRNVQKVFTSEDE